ncbi:hypothetical protein QQ008_24645 [Fulvivirgaceae bacterium BMA10]|uniref:Uncharacterized protein n=1 Tax=Splendidivirga corallicola TaxID=3051826 RepID=A0ABT8KUZ9_9BACT|nr:hypothetical protein [Fulvivirgaceae bacterium BMA10]
MKVWRNVEIIEEGWRFCTLNSHRYFGKERADALVHSEKKRIEKIELTENGFKVNCYEEITQFQWSEIEKLTGFKVDRLTMDDICIKIESNNKIVYVTEEFDGWRIFMNRLLNEFPRIDKNWEGIIAKPAFERKETELYNRNKNFG